MAVDLRDRKYVSAYSSDPLGLSVYVQGVLGDPDAESVTVTLYREEEDGSQTPVFQRGADKVVTGLYQTVLSSVETAIPGNYTVIFGYFIDGTPQEYRTFIVIGDATPAYDDLDAGMKDIVDSVWIRFADLYDSPDGGPNLQTYFQSHYGRGRLAQLLRVAVGLLNTTAQPYQSFSIEEPGQFPIEMWGSLLESALYVEALKHLVRSYVEQPAFVGGNVTRLDRRDYMDRWRLVLEDERATLKSQLEIFKISNMGLGKPRALVSGGVFGRYGPTRIAGSVAARPRYWSRFY